MAGGRDGAQQVPEHVHTTGLNQFKPALPFAVPRNGSKLIADKGFGLPDAARGAFRPTKSRLVGIPSVLQAASKSRTQTIFAPKFRNFNWS